MRTIAKYANVVKVKDAILFNGSFRYGGLLCPDGQNQKYRLLTDEKRLKINASG